MKLEEVLYKIGLFVESLTNKTARFLRGILFPSPQKNKSPLLSKFVVKKGFTVHEAISLNLQLSFILYIILNSIIILLKLSVFYLPLLFLLHMLFIRYILGAYSEYLINENNAYKVFYYGISALSFIAFLGYAVLRYRTANALYIYAYIILVVFAVLAFRQYFREKFGRDYTYGVVEEVKGDLIRVFVHDDIAANVKPGFYWLPRVEGVKLGDVVKVLVEPRAFRSSKPVRILEVLQSSHTSTEPKADAE
ncbi:DUF2101 family protein [Pyrococcus kukulkanii]|uniref:DUF2101 family protein n=1 Tax=Pyrococcus kukulkanii TaxID=1609559 RepID=UPI0035663130